VNIRGTFEEHPGNIRGTFMEHSSNFHVCLHVCSHHPQA
jgi:hypothetical protein